MPHVEVVDDLLEQTDPDAIVNACKRGRRRDVPSWTGGEATAPAVSGWRLQA
jgi:hypothetical protein